MTPKELRELAVELDKAVAREVFEGWPTADELMTVVRTMAALRSAAEDREKIASWIYGLEETYREPVVGRVLRDILATVEGRVLEAPDTYPPRNPRKEGSDD